MSANTLIFSYRKKWAIVSLAVIIFAVLGTYLIINSSAAVGDNTIEPENGTVSSPANVASDANASNGKAVKFAAAGTLTCAKSNLHVPDGPDGMGGCWPGPSNTGVPAGTQLTNYTDDCTIATPNKVIDSKTINCDIIVTSAASGLVIKNSVINGQVTQPDDGTNAPFTVQDSKIDGTVRGTGTGHDGYACTNCGVGYRNFTLQRVEIVHTNRGAYCEEVCHIYNSYIHGQNLWPDDPGHPHASAVRQEHYAYVEHNSLACDYYGPFNADIGCSADQSGYPDFTYIWHNTFNKNLFVNTNGAADFCAYGGGTVKHNPENKDPATGTYWSDHAENATYQVYTDNIFQRGANGKCGDMGGPITDFIVGRTGNVWSNNKFDNGTVVSPN